MKTVWIKTLHAFLVACVQLIERRHAALLL
jgi:hypothetical protein